MSGRSQAVEAVRREGPKQERPIAVLNLWQAIAHASELRMPLISTLEGRGTNDLHAHLSPAANTLTHPPGCTASLSSASMSVHIRLGFQAHECKHVDAGRLETRDGQMTSAAQMALATLQSQLEQDAAHRDDWAAALASFLHAVDDALSQASTCCVPEQLTSPPQLHMNTLLC